MNDQYGLQEQLDTQTGSNDLNTSVVGSFGLIIFVLVLLIQIGTAAVDRLKAALDESAKVIATQVEKIKETETQRDDANQKVQDNQEKIDSLEGQAITSKGISIAVVFDQTRSNLSVLPRLRSVLLATAEMFPMATDNFSIGVILYGNGPRVTFPLQQIHEFEKDDGASLAELHKYAKQMTCAGGQADIDRAVVEAMKMLDAAPNEKKSRQVLLICGDQNHGECAHHGPGDDAKLTRTVAAWATASGTHRRVLGLHTGAETHPARAFYEQLGKANQESEFGSDPSDIMKMIWSASFGR
jgi:hypothetical protein